MEIVINNNLFDVVEGGSVVYTAQTLTEAESYIQWRLRPNAGTGECPNC
jgi:hypothetical protein